MREDREDCEDTVAQRRGLSRRALITRAAVAGGAATLAWSAPRIETAGFSPAGASTGIIILSVASDDKQSNSGNTYCSGGRADCVSVAPTPGGSGVGCYGQSFGDAGTVETFTFTNPVPGCTQVVVRTIPLDCNSGERNPDIGAQALVISSTSGTCNCVVLEGVLIASSGRTQLETLNRGPSSCLSGGIDASLLCNDSYVTSSARLAVRIQCQT